MIVAIMGDNAKEVIDALILYRTHPGFHNTGKLSKDIDNEIKALDKAETKSMKRHCADCGKEFTDGVEADDVVEYSVNDGKDKFSLFYHNVCVPAENEFEQFDSAELVEHQMDDNKKRARRGAVRDAVLECLLGQHIPIAEIVRQTGLDRSQVNSTLTYSKKIGLVEYIGGKWRLCNVGG